MLLILCSLLIQLILIFRLFTSFYKGGTDCIYSYQKFSLCYTKAISLPGRLTARCSDISTSCLLASGRIFPRDRHRPHQTPPTSLLTHFFISFFSRLYRTALFIFLLRAVLASHVCPSNRHIIKNVISCQFVANFLLMAGCRTEF